MPFIYNITDPDDQVGSTLFNVGAKACLAACDQIPDCFFVINGPDIYGDFDDPGNDACRLYKPSIGGYCLSGTGVASYRKLGPKASLAWAQTYTLWDVGY